MMKKGVLAAVAAYTMWGFFPVYWKWLQSVPALEILSHRIVWSFFLLAIVLAIKPEKRWIGELLHNSRALLLAGSAAVLLGINWLTYVWAVNNGYIVESSLGYFINPLVNVLLGVLIFHERLRKWQWVSVSLASIGVVYLTLQVGSLPWIALTLAFSFGLYGVTKKVSGLNESRGLGVETAILTLPALAYLAYQQAQGQASFLDANLSTTILLILSGAVTVIPLLFFATAVRSIPLSTVGLLQYLAPTGQFLIGVLVYHEVFTQAHLFGFILIWIALFIFSLDTYRANRRDSVHIELQHTS
jgi:chloramphenicol-sensitive protein RarD